jgi:putative nucleotidyltransferase with HDIG domain
MTSAVPSSSARQLPQVLVTTLVVIAGPAAAVVVLEAAGLITSTIVLSAIAIALSIAISVTAGAVWKRRAASGDLLFGDLMLWGWLRRWRFELLLSHTRAMVGSDGIATPGSSQLTRERRARLLERLSRALEARDPHTHGHSRRVARHAAAIARRMGLSREEVARIRTAAVLHDVGKIDTPRKILDKKGPLSDEEYEIVKRHAPTGARMVAALGDPKMVAVVRHHHERLDGGGYPDGLAGEEIPLGARIIAVADTFDAVTSARPYREAMAHRQALSLLEAEAGTQLDPGAVRNFRRYYSSHRPVALWAAILALPRQAGLLLFDLPRFGSSLTAAKVAAASLATVAVGSALVSPAVPVSHPGNGGGTSHRVATEPAAGEGGSGGKAPAPARNDGAAPVKVSTPPVPAAAAPAESASGPSSEGGGQTASSDDSGGEEGGSEPEAPSTPASGGGSGNGNTGPPTAPVTAPVETAAAPVASSVNSTLEGVGNTVNQVTAPAAESVNGIVGQATGGLPGSGGH